MTDAECTCLADLIGPEDQHSDYCPVFKAAQKQPHPLDSAIPLYALPIFYRRTTEPLPPHTIRVGDAQREKLER
jgi:hypothetical protein